MEIFLGVILLIAAVFLIISVLMQNGKAHNLSGTIAGGAETFFGKTKGSTIDRMLSKVTSIVAIVFCVVVLAMYVFQDDTDYNNILNQLNTGDASVSDSVSDDAGDVAGDATGDATGDAADDAAGDAADDGAAAE